MGIVIYCDEVEIALVLVNEGSKQAFINCLAYGKDSDELEDELEEMFQEAMRNDKA